MKSGIHSCLISALICFLAACGNQQKTVPVRSHTEILDSYAQNFLLIGPAFESTLPRIANIGMPFGALVHISPGDSGADYCSATHFTTGKIVIAAHCVDRDQDLQNYRIVFSSKHSAHSFAKVQAEFLGSTEGLDIAVLQLEQSIAETWDTLPNPILKTTSDVVMMGAFGVTVWAFDPFIADEQIKRRYPETDGMQLRPRECVASAIEPKMKFIDSKGKKRIDKYRAPKEAKDLIFVDNCTSPTRAGNSGALITIKNDLNQVLGVYSRSILASKKGAALYRAYEYTGLDGTKRSGDYKIGEWFFDVGAIIGALPSSALLKPQKP